MRRVILSVVVLAVLGGALLVIPTVWGKPWSIDHYFTRVMIEFALDHPMLLSYARVLDPYGLDFYSRDLEDLSIEAERRQAAQVRRALEGLRAYDDDELDESQRLSKEVLEWFLVTLELGEPFQLHSYPVEQFRGWQSTLPDFMVNFHAIENSGDASEYLSRLRKFPTAFKQLTDAVRYRAERGMLPPRFVIRAVRKEIADFTAHPIQENPLYQKLGRELRALPDLDPLKRYSKMSDAASLIENAVYGSYRYLDRTLEELEPLATDDDGVWKLPDGDAYYRWTLRFHTTTDLGPDEIHEIGLREVDRIRGEMSALLEELGLPTDHPIATVQDFNREERFLFPDSDEGRAEILASYQAIIDETEAKLPALFGTLPQAKVTVERVPAFKEAGSAGAYYNPPPLDGSRPGIFYANLRSVEEVPRFGMRTLAFHEAIPGHHLQIALAMENRDLPLFRRFVPFTAFVEGWALYAERLAAEQGFHPTPYDRLGQLQAEIFRAVRLVVDTGIHAKRWPREQAIEYMLQNTGMPRGDVVAEVERYIVAPGQACAHKLGQLRILELRDRARARLGDRFELRDFHDVILRNGSLPLAILERVVDRWIEAS